HVGGVWAASDITIAAPMFRWSPATLAYMLGCDRGTRSDRQEALILQGCRRTSLILTGVLQWHESLSVVHCSPPLSQHRWPLWRRTRKPSARSVTLFFRSHAVPKRNSSSHERSRYFTRSGTRRL